MILGEESDIPSTTSIQTEPTSLPSTGIPQSCSLVRGLANYFEDLSHNKDSTLSRSESMNSLASLSKREQQDIVQSQPMEMSQDGPTEGAVQSQDTSQSPDASQSQEQTTSNSDQSNSTSSKDTSGSTDESSEASSAVNSTPTQSSSPSDIGSSQSPIIPARTARKPNGVSPILNVKETCPEIIRQLPVPAPSSPPRRLGDLTLNSQMFVKYTERKDAQGATVRVREGNML